MALQTAKLAFKPRARLLLLLGDQLIRDAGIAVFELVKNAYDADSPNAIVTMTNVETREEGRILVEDSGVGMDFETVTKVWLEPGTDFRATQKGESKRTPIFHRLPMGEKGVGRFAAHKLGNRIRMVTRSAGNPEVVVDIDWTKFQSGGYLSDVPVTVEEREPKRFPGKKTGTRIRITQLRSSWNRAMVRDLHRSVTSICSPFTTGITDFDPRLKIEGQEDIKGNFEAVLVLPDAGDWLKGLLSVDKVLDFSLFRARCMVDGSNLKYDYRFIPFPAMTKVKRRHEEQGLDGRPMPVYFSENYYPRLLDEYVGPFCADLYIFDRDPQVLSLGVTDKAGLREFLNQSGGIRVYRDGIRVYDYGEPGNDWLNLDKKRVNIPAARISNNLVVGGVFLSLKTSSGMAVEDEDEASLGLIEKTNREGFVENSTFRAFTEALNFAIAQIVSERNKDKDRIRSAYSSKQFREPVLGDLGELRKRIEQTGPPDLVKYVDRIERDYRDVRDRLLTSASAGLSLMVVIHEVEKGVAELLKAVEREHSSEKIVSLAQHISKLVEGLGAIARGSGTSRQRASELIRIAEFNTELRLEAHGIERITEIDRDFEAVCSKRLIVSTLMNLIDNSIWWIDNRWGRDKRPKRKKLFIGTTDQLHEPAIIIADNGPGLSDPREYLIQPFFSRKPDGMGLGLHLADQVMTLQGGRLEFPEKGDIELPKGLDGAAVALLFGGGRWKA